MTSHDFRNGGEGEGEGFSGDMVNLFPPSLHLGTHDPILSQPTEGANPEMGLQILNPSIFQSQENRGTKGTIDEGEGNNSLCLKLGDEVEEEEAKNSSSSRKTGYAKLCARGHWRPAEDAQLKELVAQFGPQNWNLIAEHLQGRSGKSCRLRWFNQLDPRINKRAFSEEEEERLLTAHKIYGNKWAMIARLFPGRTDNAVKNQWHVIDARKKREQQSSVYRRRKHTVENLPNSGLKLTLSNNNAASESTISSTIDESFSTCTNLSLTPSSAKLTPSLIGQLGPPVQFHHGFGSLIGESSGSGIAKVDMNYDKFYGAWNWKGEQLGRLMGVVDQSNLSDSNSEVSVSESVATTNRSNLSISGESENVGDKMNMPIFIDFLGVGDC